MRTLTPSHPHQWHRRRFVDVPPFTNTAKIGRPRDTVFHRHQEAYSSISGESCHTTIKRLLQRSSPTAILRGIPDGVVNPVDCQNIGITVGDGPIAERLKGTPFATNTNSPATVFGIARLIPVEAPTSDSSPYIIEPRLALAVGSSKRSYVFTLGATTRRVLSRPQVGPINPFLRAARASAKPDSLPSRCASGLLNYSPPRIHMTSHVNHFYHTQRYTRKRVIASILMGAFK